MLLFEQIWIHHSNLNRRGNVILQPPLYLCDCKEAYKNVSFRVVIQGIMKRKILGGWQLPASTQCGQRRFGFEFVFVFIIISYSSGNSVVLNKHFGWMIYPKSINVWSEISMWSDFSILYLKAHDTNFVLWPKIAKGQIKPKSRLASRRFF